MINQKKRFTACLAAICCLVLVSGCRRTDRPEVYIDDRKPDVTISLFTQGSAVTEAIDECCRDILNVSGESNLILFSDSADFYGEEGLSYRELLLKRMESGQADDLFLIHAEDVFEFDRKGYLYDLSELKCMDNLSQDALQQSIYNGKVFSIPLSYACFGFIWNMDMLKQYDLDLPSNLDEFWQVCETLKQNGIIPYGANKDFGLGVPAMCAGLGPLYQGTDTDQLLTDLASGKTPVSTYMRGGFVFLQTMIDKGYLDAAQALSTLPSSDEEAAYFRDGKCAFISALCRAKAFSGDYPFEVSMTALPVLKDGYCCVVGADNRLAVNPNSKHLAEALMIVESLGRVEALDNFAAQLGKISSARGNKALTLPQADQLVACVADGGQIPNQDFSLPFNTWDTIKELCVRLCQGESVEELCGEYDQIQLQEIAQYQNSPSQSGH